MRLWQLGLPAVALFLGDQYSKALVHATMAQGASAPVVGNVLKISYVRNSGAAFGILSGSGFPFVYVSIAAIALLLLYFLRRVKRSGLRVVSLGFIIGGALGNLVDRLRMGEVIDFIDVGWHQWRWPVFNVADVGVTIGFILLIFSLSLGSSHDAKDWVAPDDRA